MLIQVLNCHILFLQQLVDLHHIHFFLIQITNIVHKHFRVILDQVFNELLLQIQLFRMIIWLLLF